MEFQIIKCDSSQKSFLFNHVLGCIIFLLSAVHISVTSCNTCCTTLAGSDPNFVSATVELNKIPPVAFLRNVTSGGNLFNLNPT